MTSDPKKSAPRQFQCREYLWEALEQFSAETESPLDYLLNEALRQFLRSQNRGLPWSDTPEQPDVPARVQPLPPTPRFPQVPGPLGGAAPPGGRLGSTAPPRPVGAPAAPSAPRLPSLGNGPAQPRLPSMGGGPMPPPAQRPQPPPMGGGGMGRPTNPPSMPGQGGVGMRPQPPAQQPPPQRQPPPQQPPQQLPPQMPPQAGRGGGSLVAIYEGQQYPVTKEEFIIGRGQKTSDLTIRDSNVSRRHASVVLYNNQYWIVDQQSTNGIEYKGQKIERKVVEDGDSYKICDHEIRFVYR